ncbi:hypothetical protein CHS0354_006420 [Potamilus streckersoni]|uniref:Uncharacterized protein n=1 Tax=Potamilus streckersoni TaxID=2493646 RepID=A0AAE0T9C6_9BIVA|nr:hypothetical protein CHS0354_006420 [Potamilus streckersoni]
MACKAFQFVRRIYIHAMAQNGFCRDNIDHDEWLPDPAMDAFELAEESYLTRLRWTLFAVMNQDDKIMRFYTAVEVSALSNRSSIDGGERLLIIIFIYLYK